MKNTGIVIASLVGGMIIGSALTMLFTPQSGAELRKQIKDLIGDEVDKVREKVDEVRGKVEEHFRCRIDYLYTPEGRGLKNPENLASLKKIVD